MKVLLYILLWCFICPLWQLTQAIDDQSRIEVELSNLEVGLKTEIEDRLHAVVKKWAEA